jgi:hypothetical protein
MKRIALLALFVMLFAGAAPAQTAPDAKGQNLRNCLSGLGVCDRSLLTAG